MTNVLNRALVIAGASALLLLTAACGGSDNTGTGTSTTVADGGGDTGGSGGGDKAAICADATKAFTQYGTDAGASAGDLGAFNQATSKLAATLKQLAGTADGDLKTTLSGMADSWSGVKIDTSDPAGSAAKVLEFAKKATEASTKLATACS
jgi:hypothetical protein